MKVYLSEAEARLLKEFLMIEVERSVGDNEELAETLENVIFRIESELKKSYINNWQAQQQKAKAKEVK